MLKIGCAGIIVLVVLLVTIAALAGGSSKDATTASAPSGKSSPPAEPAKEARSQDQKTLEVTTAAPKPTEAPKPTATAKPTEAPKPTATPEQVYKVGDKVTAANWEYTVAKTDTTKTLVWTSLGNKITAKGQYLIVYLTLKNVGKENFGINSWDFELYAGDVKYTPVDELAFWMWAEDNGLSPIKLGEKYPPGVKVKTGLLFDVAPDAPAPRLRLVQAKKDILLR